jgi:2-iminoacetate synthase ThiH
VVVANFCNNNNKYCKFARVRVSRVSSLERKRRAMEMGMEALDEGFKGASFRGGL